MDYPTYYQQNHHQSYDPNSQFYHQPATNYDYSSYSYHQPVAHHHEVQEPNPPGVLPSAQTQYYQYAAPVAPHYQPIVQSAYGSIGSSDGNYVGSSDGNFTQEIPPFHSGARTNASNRPSRGRGHGRGNGRGRGRGRSLPRQHIPQYSTSLNSGPTGQPVSVPAPPKVVRCEVCNIECDTNEILELHKNGKKHQKNLKKNALGGHTELTSNSNVVSEAPLWPNQVEGNSNVYGSMPAQPLPQYQVGLVIQGPSRPAPGPPKAVSCELCKVECNTAEIFEKHKNGKKHQKNLKVHEELQKWKSASTVQVEHTSTSEFRPEAPSQPEKIEQSQGILTREVGNEQNEVAVEKQKAEDVEPTEESAGKVTVDQAEGRGRGFKRKMRGGRGGRSTRPFNGSKRPVEPPKEVVPLVCELCNVKCESLVVFQSHLAGKKHQMKAKRYLTPQEIFGQEILAAIGPALQVLMQQGALASTSMAAPLQHQGYDPYTSAVPQNVGNFQAPALGANADNATMEALSHLQSLLAPHLVNMQGMPNGGHPINQGEIYYPANGMATEQALGVPSTIEPVASEPVNGASEPVPGLNTTTGQVEVPANGAGSAQ